MLFIIMYLFLPQDLFQVLEHDSLNRVDCHPEGVQTLANQLLALFFGMSDVEHDETDDVVVKGEGCLLGQLRDEPYQGPEGLEDCDCAFPGQLLHEVLEEQIAVFHQARPDDLKKLKHEFCAQIEVSHHVSNNLGDCWLHECSNF